MITIKKLNKLFFLLFAFGLILSCEFSKTEEGKMPDLDMDVDVDADYDGGELPEFDVDWDDVNVGTTTKTVKVPKVVIVMEEEEIEVPTLDIDMTDGEEKTERTLMIDAEVTDREHDIEIKEIWATDKTLNVIATLEALETSIGDKKLRVQDQISINAPDLDVRYFVVGERPDRAFNSKYTFVKTMSDLDNKIGDHEVIYKR